MQSMKTKISKLKVSKEPSENVDEGVEGT